MTRSTRRALPLVVAAIAVVVLAGAAVMAHAAGSGTVLNSTIKVSKSGFKGGGKRYVAGGALGDGGQSEGQKPLFELADGATLENVVIGSPAADGVHCLGSCTLRNVVWEDVGEDAATFLGTSPNTKVLITGGSARHAHDKVFQHNGAGTVTITGNFYVEDFGKLYRSCGNCKKQYQRNVVIQGVRAKAPGKTLAGVNVNYGDTASISGVTIEGDSKKKISICDRFTGNSKGSEPKKVGSGPDGRTCRASGITYR